MHVHVHLTYYLLLTTYYLLLTTHYSPLTTHYSRLTTHDSPLTTHYSPLTTHDSRLTTHYSLLQGDDFEHQSLDEKLESLKLQRQSSRDTYSPGGSLANLGIEIIAQADSRSSRRAKLEDAHYPGSANAARVIAVLAPEALPFEPKLTKVSAPQARLLAARAAKSSKRLRVPTEPAPYLQTTP